MNQNGHHGRSHARAAHLMLPGLMDGVVGHADGAGQRLPLFGNPFQRAAHLRVHARLCAFPEVIQHDIDTHLAGYFARGLPAHAVAHHVDAVARVITEVIFVIGAHAAHVGFSRYFHKKIHSGLVAS